MRSEPRGYWTRVFDQAATLLRSRPDLNGDAAYWAARRIVDQTLADQDDARSLFEPRDTTSVLVLAP